MDDFMKSFMGDKDLSTSFDMTNTKHLKILYETC